MRRHRNRGGGAFVGTLFILIGASLLLERLGVIEPRLMDSFWEYWPLLVIGWGLFRVLRAARSARAWSSGRRWSAPGGRRRRRRRSTMNAAKVRGSEVARLALELMLASFACWLVIQNTLLLAFDPWASRPVALVAASALVKAAGLVLASVWPWAVLAAVGSGLTGLWLAARIAASRRHGGVA